MTLLRSTIFIVWFFFVTLFLAVVFLPALLLPRGLTLWMARTWVALNFWGLRVFAGLGFEVRGALPPNGVL
ncbi:MAG TPA: hypothetical protein VGB91_02075, partial [Rhizomicrobium sp.]